VFVVDKYLGTGTISAIVDAMVQGVDLTDNSDSSTCRSVAAGTSKQATDRLASCITCSAGKYATAASSECAAGTYSNAVVLQAHTPMQQPPHAPPVRQTPMPLRVAQRAVCVLDSCDKGCLLQAAVLTNDNGSAQPTHTV